MNKSQEEKLSNYAWQTRKHAVARKTKVGCALITFRGETFMGCNIEHDFGKVLHAEEVAIAEMVKCGCKDIQYILIVADRKSFIPCGACLDWIHQFQGVDTMIGFQSKPTGRIDWYAIEELMPYYPQK